MINMTRTFVLFCSLLSAQTHAGWVSGGGELSTDESNPWFLFNTTTVHFCVLIDDANFGIDRITATNQFRKAWNYWRSQFQQTEVPEIEDTKVTLATQDLQEVPCNSGLLDLKVQFGVLDPEQAAYLKQPKHLVGVAVRTQYDEVALKAKGFLYISPESGPLALDGLSADGSIVPRRWSSSEGFLLDLVLVHEIGHIFGLSHNDMNSLMSSGMPTFVVHRFTEEALEGFRFLGIPKYFMGKERDSSFIDNSGPLEDAVKALSIPVGTKGLKLTPSTEPGFHYDLFSFDPNKTNVLLGRIGRLLDTDLHAGYGTTSTLITLFLTSKQSLFPLQVPDVGSVYDLMYPTERGRTYRYYPNCRGCPSRHISFNEERTSLSITVADSRGNIIKNALDMEAESVLNNASLTMSRKKSRR